MTAYILRGNTFDLYYLLGTSKCPTKTVTKSRWGGQEATRNYLGTVCYWYILDVSFFNRDEIISFCFN